jgi:hypothetical protein
MNIDRISIQASGTRGARKSFFRDLAIPTAALFLFCSGIVAARAGGVICFEDWGVHVRDTAFNRSSDTRLLADKLAKGGDYVLVKDCTSQQGVEDWFVYSSSTAFQSGFKQQMGQDVTKGLDLELEPGQGKKIFTDKDLNLNVFGYLMDVAHPKVFIVEGDCEIPEGYFRQFPDPPLVLHLRSSYSADNAQKSMDVISRLRETPAQDIAVFSLIPPDPAAMVAWQFDDFKANLYAENAKKILSDLANWGASTAKPTSKEEFLNAVKNSPQSTFVLIGESSDGGKSIRIPGTNAVLTAEDFSGIPSSKRIIGLICGSEHMVAQYPGLSVIGTIFTDQSQTILRFALDRRPAATTAEFIDGGENFYGKVVFTTALGFYGASAVTVHVLEAPPPTPTVPTDNQLTYSVDKNPPPSNLMLLGLGAFGAFLKEFLRWRTLAVHKRTDLFLTPGFIFFSALFIACGAVVGLIFGSWTASGPVGVGMAHIVAWVAGVGIEELVRRAAKLQIWTPPVAMGQLAEGSLPTPTQPSLLEFLRS